MQKLKEKQDKEFDKIFPCIRIQNGCSNNGIIPEQDEQGDWVPTQCEYCYKVRFPVKEFIDKVRQETAKYERERIKKIMNKELLSWNSGGEYYDNVSKAIQNILNKLK